MRWERGQLSPANHALAITISLADVLHLRKKKKKKFTLPEKPYDLAQKSETAY